MCYIDFKKCCKSKIIILFLYFCNICLTYVRSSFSGISSWKNSSPPLPAHSCKRSQFHCEESFMRSGKEKEMLFFSYKRLTFPPPKKNKSMTSTIWVFSHGWTLSYVWLSLKYILDVFKLWYQQIVMNLGSITTEN